MHGQGKDRMMSTDLLDLATGLAPKVASMSADVASRNIGRESIVRATMLATIAGHPAFFLGSPGINKTGTVKDLSRVISGSVYYGALMPTITSFEGLFVEQTSIEESVGADGCKSIRTRDQIGRAADAHFFFADEIWKGEPRVLQTVLDFANGDAIRHEGRDYKTPLLAFLAASNELPDPEGNLGAMWSRMTIRLVVNPLDRGGKTKLVAARLNRDRGTNASAPAQLSLVEVETLREARPHVEVPADIIETVLGVYEELLRDDAAGFDWLWNDDRRFGRVFDVLQASALLDGRAKVGSADLRVLEYLLWDTPEQIPVVKAKIAPLVRTPLGDAQEQVDALFAPGGTVELGMNDRSKLVPALSQFEQTEKDLARLEGEASGNEKTAIGNLRKEVAQKKADFVAHATGVRR